MASIIDTSSLLPQVASRGVPDDYERVQSTPDTFGAGVGRALEGAGQDFASSASFWGKVVSDGGYNDSVQAANKLLYGDPNNPKKNPDGTTSPDTGYFGLRGRDALDARPVIEQKLNQIYTDALGKMPSADTKLQYDSAFRRYHTLMSERIGSHADQQSLEYGKATNNATDSISLNAIAAAPNDDDLFQHHLGAVVGAAQQNAQIAQGAHPGDDQWKAASIDATARAWDARLVSIAATDPVKAQAMLNAHRDEVGDKFAALESHIRARATAANGDAAADQAIHETAHGAPPPPGAPRVQNAVAVGDSLANGVQTTGKLTGDTLVGRPSAGVLKAIDNLPQNTGNQPIVLSSGLSNDGAAANPNVVAQQISALHDKGYRDIRVLGVGDKFAQFNPTIQKIAEANGAKFVSIGPNDGVHPTDGYKTATQGALGGASGERVDAAHIAKGTLASNQDEAYRAARAEGLSDPAARAVVANLSGESLATPADHHWDGSHYSQGIASWDDQRSAAIKAHFGQEPKDMSIADQVKAHIWEMRTNPAYSNTWMTLNAGKDPEAMVSTLVREYERPANPDSDIKNRVGFYHGLNARMGNGGGQYAPSQVAGGAPGTSATPTAPGANGLPVQDAAFTPATPGVVQGVTPQVASARQMEAEAIRRVEARTDLDDDAKQHAISRIQRVSATAAIAAEEDTKSREEAAKTATVDYMRRIHNGDIKAVGDMYNDPRLASNPGAIRELQTFAQQAGIEDKASYGPGFQSLMNKMLLPYGDPARISTPEQILKMANGEPGTLTSAGADRLIRLQGTLEKPDEAALHASAASVLNGVKKQISFQGEGQFDPKDPKGEAAFNLKFVPSFWSAFDAWRAEGKNPWDFLKDDKTISALVKASARKPDEMKWDQLQAEGAQIVTDPNAEKLPVPPAPPNVDATAWGATLTQRKFVVNTPKGYVQPTPQAWAKVLGGLVSDPTPENIERFDNSMWGKAAGNDGAALVKKLAASAAAAPVAPAQPDQPAAPGLDAPVASPGWLQQGFSNLVTTPEEKERQAKARVEAEVGPQPEPAQQGGVLDALSNLFTNSAQNDARKEEKRKRHIAEGREPPK